MPKASPAQTQPQPTQPTQPQFNPGDVIAFSGNGFDAKIIQWFTLSPYSHTAIVLGNGAQYQRPEDILIAESTTYTNLSNFQNQSCQQGVQIHWLSTWLESYQAAGQAWCFPLKTLLEPDKMTQMQAWLWNLHHSRVPFSCPKSVGAWFARSKFMSKQRRAKLDQRAKASRYSSGFFCSELVIEALRVAGVVHPQINPASHTPKDVAQLDCFNAPQLIPY